MLKSYAAKYTRIESGYMGQLVEWPEVVTEGKTLEECRGLLKDALREMILAYTQQGKENPVGGGLRCFGNSRQIPPRAGEFPKL